MALILTLPVAYSYDKIIQFDENEDIIVSTSVYNATGKKCTDCSCNLTIYNPAPKETFINISIQMVNNGNGIYTANVSNYTKLTFNRNIYPFTILCNDTVGFFGGDNRDGIKVSETLFDYTAGVLVLIGIAAIFLMASFKVDRQYFWIKRLCFFSTFIFLISASFLGYFIMQMSPESTPFSVTMKWAAIALMMIVMAIMYLWLMQRFTEPVEDWQKGVR